MVYRWISITDLDSLLRIYNTFLFYFRTPYAKNPFDSVSDQEIEEYKRQVEMSQKGISGKLHDPL
jgi:hypothetical protein